MRIADLAEIALSSNESAALGVPHGAVRLRRAWPRSPDHVLVEYITADGTIVPGQWHRHDEALAAAADQTRRGARRPERVRVVPCANESQRLLLQAGGEDAVLRALAPFLEEPSAQLIVHRPERRAVVRVEGCDGVLVYAKFLPPRRIADLARREAVLRAALSCAPFSMPDVIELDLEEGMIRYAAAQGESLHHLLLRVDAVPMCAIGGALRGLHGLAIERGRLSEHDPAEETIVLSKWMDHLRIFDPARAATLACEFERVKDALLALAPIEPAILHRDFYDKQVFVDGRGITFIDADTVALGDAALDVGNMIAHLEHHDAGRAPGLARQFLDGYGPIDEARLEVYLASSRLRLKCVHAFRPPF